MRNLPIIIIIASILNFSKCEEDHFELKLGDYKFFKMPGKADEEKLFFKFIPQNK
jgi:hypothetical protein